MSRVADLELFWTPSPTPGAVSQKLEVTVGAGTAIVDNIPLTDDLYAVTVPANTDFSLTVITKMDDGREVKSMKMSRTLGPLEDVIPATELGFRIVNVRDVPDEPPAPPA